MIRKILIPNRGDTALRIVKACRDLNIISVVAHSTADELSMPVRLADESICIGGPLPSESYFNMSAIISAAHIMQCDAIHPGIGFLSENAKFAKLVEDNNLIFIGPKYEHIDLLGNKIKAKEIAKEIGLPIVEGSNIINSLEEAKKQANLIKYPILIKAVAGGGGIGMQKVYAEEQLEKAYNEAKLACKNLSSDDLYIEKLLLKPRHIEFQVLCDKYNNVICLGDRDCSIQRKHQKIWEEAPATVISNEIRQKMIALIIQAMSKLKYINACTLEFLYEDEQFYFIEANTRLQVEHAITEMITNIDIVHQQIYIAEGKKLQYKQSDIKFNGMAIECRINAENPRTFIPSAGTVDIHIPSYGPGIRIDTYLYPGYKIPHYYDSMTGKLIVWAHDRQMTIRRLKGALEDYVVIGVDTLIPLFKYLCTHKDIIENKFYINWLEDILSTDTTFSP